MLDDAAVVDDEEVLEDAVELGDDAEVAEEAVLELDALVELEAAGAAAVELEAGAGTAGAGDEVAGGVVVAAGVVGVDVALLAEDAPVVVVGEADPQAARTGSAAAVRANADIQDRRDDMQPTPLAECLAPGSG